MCRNALLVNLTYNQQQRQYLFTLANNIKGNQKKKKKQQNTHLMYVFFQTQNNVLKSLNMF